MAKRQIKEKGSAKRQNKVSSIIEIEEAQKRRKEKRATLIKQEKVQRRREKTLEKRNRPKMTRGKKLAVAGVLALTVLIFAFNGYRIVNLNLNKAAYEQQYEEKTAEKARLEKELSLVDDPEYVEQQARDRFHMLRQGETLFMFPESAPVEAQ